MANWTVTQQTLTAVPSTFETADTTSASATLTINPNYGYAISAENFIIGGATEITSSVVGEYIFEGGNVDAEVQKVVFSDNGTAGQPDNSVRVDVFLNAMPSTPSSVETWPASDTIYIDIDDRPSVSEPVDPNADVPGPATDVVERLACLKAFWPYSAVQSVSVADLSNIDETVTQGSSSVQPNSVHQGIVDDDTSTVIAKITFAITDTAANFYPNVNVNFNGLTNEGYDYSNYYTYEIDYTYTNNLITSFTVAIIYTPPSTPPLDPDPQTTFTKFCQLGHQVFIDYVIKETQTVVSDEVKRVRYNASVPFSGGTEAISVHGSVGATYEISLQRKASTTSTTPSATPNYNFGTGVFEAVKTIENGTIGSNGSKVHYVNFSDVIVDTRYDIVLTATGTSRLHANVPDADGEAIITQYGLNTVTIKPYSTSTHYESFDLAASTHMVHRPKPYTGTNQISVSPEVIRTEGGNKDTSSTRVLLNTPVPDGIEPGMICCVNNATGASIIPHNTTVTSLYKNVLTLSAAAAIPDNTELRFVKNNSALISFSVVADGQAGRQLTATGGSPTAIDIVSGAGSETISLDVVGDVNNSTTIALVHNSRLQAGMKVTGPGIAGELDSDGTTFTTITAVGSSRQITVAAAQDLKDGDTLRFSSTSDAPVQTGIRPLDIQYSVNTTTDIATIQGYFLIEDIVATGDILLNIDPIITNASS